MLPQLQESSCQGHIICKLFGHRLLYNAISYKSRREDLLPVECDHPCSVPQVQPGASSSSQGLEQRMRVLDDSGPLDEADHTA